MKSILIPAVPVLVWVIGLIPNASAAEAPAVIWTVDVAGNGPEVSPMMHGIFFEDINFAGDGGLYAELVENRSFIAKKLLSR